MLDQFRSLSGSLPAKILLAFLVLSFGVWGIGDMVRDYGRNATVATIGSEIITIEDLSHALHREIENVRNILGDRYSPELVQSLNLQQEVLQKLINRALLSMESRSLGLMPTDAEVVRRIRNNPAFRDENGNFSKAIFEDTLRGSDLTETAYVEQLRQDMASNLLLDTINSAAPISDIAVRTLYDAQEEQRAVTVYSIPPSLITDVAQPSESQIKTYYDDHKNEFTAPEYRTISYVAISPADMLTTTISEDELQAVYHDRIDEFKRPERRTVMQLLYSSEEKAKAAEALLKSGKNFASVAKETDIINKDSISLGKVTKSAVLLDAADAVFSLPVGGHTDPIASPFGWHIFEVTAIEQPSITPFEEVRAQIKKNLEQREAGEAQSQFTNRLEDALAGGATLKEAADELKLKVENVGPIDHQGLMPDGSKPKDIAGFDKFLNTAFKTDEKTESPLTAASGGIYYILRVDSITPERLRALDEVRGLVIASWQKEERRKILAQLAKDIAGKFISNSRAGAIAHYKLQPVTGTLRRSDSTLGKLALPPQLVTDAFQHKLQENTEAYLDKNGDYLLAVVTGIIPPPPPDKDPKLMGALADIRNSLKETKQNEIFEQYAQYLAKKYPVSINETVLQSVKK